MNGKIHRQCWWMQGTCGQNRTSAKALGAKNKMPKRELEKDHCTEMKKYMRLKEAIRAESER
jgi:hypothetical protein